MSSFAEGNVGLAFGLVVGAGAATCIGSSLVFCTGLANTRLLAGCLGISVGVMLYVSFAEIFCVKSVEAFEEHYAGDPDSAGKALRMATFCFFSGMIFIAALNAVVKLLEGMANPSTPRLSSDTTHGNIDNDIAAAASDCDKDDGMDKSSLNDGSVVLAVVAADDTYQQQHAERGDATENEELESRCYNGLEQVPDSVKEIMECDYDHAGLSKIGLLSGLAIAIHNFPEGLATFVAALAEPKAGVALAIATALHNIPEGICVAMPVYYATGSKWKGFFWSFLSGVTEPLGGLVGYLILWNSVTPLTYAIMFGLVGGMMVYISLRDLLPTALRYDPEDSITTTCVFIGMAVMAASLLMFTI